jgi:hypothetical protein
MGAFHIYLVEYNSNFKSKFCFDNIILFKNCFIDFDVLSFSNIYT